MRFDYLVRLCCFSTNILALQIVKLNVLVLIAATVSFLHIFSFAEVTSDKPQFAVASEIRAQIDRGNMKGAFQALRAASEQGLLNNSSVSTLQGQFFREMGQPEKAILSFELALKESNYLNAYAFVGLASSFLIIGEIEKARAHLDSAFLLDPTFVPAAITDIKLKLAARENFDAIQAYAALQKSSNFDENVDFAYARYLITLSSSQASVVIRKMRDRASDSPLIVELLAQAYFLEGALCKAVKNFEAARDLYKQDDDEYSVERISNWMSSRRQRDSSCQRSASRDESFRGHGLDDTEAIAEGETQEQSLKQAIDKATKSNNLDISPNDPLVQAPGEADDEKGFFPDETIIFSPKAIPDEFIINHPDSVKTGSGFITNNGAWVVTNRHVIEGWKKIQVRNGLGDLREVVEVREDEYLDLAILVLGSAYDSGVSQNINEVLDPKTGQTVFLMGFPLSNFFGAKHPIISSGIVSSAFGFGESPSQFQITAKMNKGNSGGPVFNRNGQVVGVAVSKLNKKSITESTGVTPEDVNFALKGSEIRRFANLGRSSEQVKVSAPVNAEDIYARKRGAVVVVINETE